MNFQPGMSNYARVRAVMVTWGCVGEAHRSRSVPQQRYRTFSLISFYLKQKILAA
ncbi:hypothetical protein H6G33_21310 [Calothrix sp. FACHB-1219]|uniref:hypothetical protein n=1 Tax=unclassified Calothrix TaxID=2619626 RepID=UPI00168795BF|nr:MULTISPECIES: hypothetical protein [unclassified Calothrix]MBD2203738.1 hypothetical protein [Calothrix sp. FACHB-168]MBD2219558.1 hypothetical protein [Calothrix sp. FACHB-1219]